MRSINDKCKVGVATVLHFLWIFSNLPSNSSLPMLPQVYRGALPSCFFPFAEEMLSEGAGTRGIRRRIAMGQLLAVPTTMMALPNGGEGCFIDMCSFLFDIRLQINSRLLG